MEKRSPRKSTKNRLIEETIRQIRKHGPEHISLRQIAARCGVTHAAAYKYFTSKQELIDATRPYIVAKLRPYLKRSLTLAQDGDDPYVVLCKAYLRYMTKHPNYHYLVHSCSCPPHDLPRQDSARIAIYGFEKYAPLADSFLSRCDVPAEERPMLLALLYAMLNGLVSLLNKKTVVYVGDAADLVDTLILSQLHLAPRRPAENIAEK